VPGTPIGRQVSLLCHSPWAAGAFRSAKKSTSDVLYSGAMQIGNQQSEIETRYALYRGLMTTGGVKSRAGQISGEVRDSRAVDARQWLLGAMRPHVFEQNALTIQSDTYWHMLLVARK
jgi:hypothetical protein